MTVTMLKSKIHRATVTEANLNYVGSITIDSSLMKAAGIFEYEKVQIVGFGTFEVRHRSERQGRDPRTNEPMTIAASNSPAFKAGKAFKDAVSK